MRRRRSRFLKKEEGGGVGSGRWRRAVIELKDGWKQDGRWSWTKLGRSGGSRARREKIPEGWWPCRVSLTVRRKERKEEEVEFRKMA